MVVYDTYLREKGKFGSTVLEVHFVTTAGAELSLEILFFDIPDF